MADPTKSDFPFLNGREQIEFAPREHEPAEPFTIRTYVEFTELRLLKDLKGPFFPSSPGKQWRAPRHFSQPDVSARTVFPFHAPTPAGAFVMMEHNWNTRFSEVLHPLAEPEPRKAEVAARQHIGTCPVDIPELTGSAWERYDAAVRDPEERDYYIDSTGRRSPKTTPGTKAAEKESKSK